MRLVNLSKATLFGAMLLLSTFIHIPASNAQLTIQLGGDEGQLHALLTSRGYDRIETVKLRITHSRFNACKDGKRYHLDVKWTGVIDKRVTGKCRSLVNIQSITKTLEKRGYERVNVQQSQGQYTAIACARGNRYRINISDVGDIKNESRIGRCNNRLNSSDLLTKLRAQKYNRIEFTDLNPPKIRASACKDRTKYNLTLNQFGEITRRREVGNCHSRINSKDIVKTLQKTLEKNGFTQIQITDKKPPNYRAFACKEDRRLKVTLNRYGQVTDEIYEGYCEKPYSSNEIREAMLDQGYTKINITKNKDKTFTARGCIQGRLTDVELTQYGKFISRKDRGSCNTIRVNELADILRKRGLKNLEFSVVGCRKGKLEKIIFDEYANRIDTDFIGKCR